MRLSCRRRFSGLSLLLVLGLACSTLWAAVPAAQPGVSWYRGNTHCHSFWSDGDQFPEMVALWYKQHSYDFLTISDHNRLMEGEYWRNLGGKKPVTPTNLAKCRERFGADWVMLRGEGTKAQVRLKTLAEIRPRLEEPGKFLMIQSEEITGKFVGPAAETQIHVNAINLAELIPPQKGQSALECLRMDLQAVAEQARRLHRPILTHVNHPTWKYFDISAELLAETREARLFEVCNYASSEYLLGDKGRPGIEKIWDIANTLRIARMKLPPLFGVGSDDTHHYHTVDPTKSIPGRGWIMVRAAKLETAVLLEAMAQGDFYATTGVILKEFRFDRDARTVSVEIDAERGARYTIEFIGTPTNYNAAVEEKPGFDKEGKPAGTFKTYSADVGKVLAKVEGPKAVYRLTGEELYVRAAIRSDRPVSSPKISAFSTKQAWCQPVGWELRVKP